MNFQNIFLVNEFITKTPFNLNLDKSHFIKLIFYLKKYFYRKINLQENAANYCITLFVPINFIYFNENSNLLDLKCARLALG